MPVVVVVGVDLAQPWVANTLVPVLQRADKSSLAEQGADTWSRAVREEDTWSVASVVAGTPSWAAWPVVVEAEGAGWVLPWVADTSQLAWQRANRCCLALLVADTPTWEGADTLALEGAGTLALVVRVLHSCSQQAFAGSVL